MKKKTISAIMLTLLLTCMLTLAFNILPVRASGTVYIRPDGTVEGTDKIRRDGEVYTFTDNIYDSIMVERDNIVVDGAGYTVQGARNGDGIGLYHRHNVTIKNTKVINFAEGIYLYRSSNNTLANNAASNNVFGMILSSSSNNTLDGNAASNNVEGIDLSSSSNNVLVGNIASPNHMFGINLVYSSNNVFVGNIASSTGYGDGIRLYSSSNNVFVVNTVSNNIYGIYLGLSSNNTFFHNSFIDNIRFQVSTRYSASVWDDGYPSGGNYWSDHVTVDERYGVEQNKRGSDGIVDEPYVIDEYNRDNYPLVEPWSPRPPPPLEDLEELIETIKSWNLPEGTENSLTSKLEETIHLLNQTNENGAIHKLVDLINEAEALRDKIEDWHADYLISEAQRIIDLIKG